MSNNSTYRLANAIFAWEKEITVPIIVTDGSAEFDEHYVNVPIAEVSREFCLDFSDENSQLDMLKRIELAKIQSLVFPLENISIVPLLGFQKSREIAKITGDLTLFSFARLSRHLRYSAELAPFKRDLMHLGLSWLLNSYPRDYLEYFRNSDNEVKNYLRDSYIEDYLRVWSMLTKNATSEALLNAARDRKRANFETIDNFAEHEKVDVLDDWLNLCSRRTRALIRLRNGLTPNFRHRCTQELVGQFLILSQAAISHIERESFGKRCYTFCDYLLRRFDTESVTTNSQSLAK